MAIFGWLCLLAITCAVGLSTLVGLLWENACPGAVGRAILVPVAITAVLIYALWALCPFTVRLAA